MSQWSKVWYHRVSFSCLWFEGNEVHTASAHERNRKAYLEKHITERYYPGDTVMAERFFSHGGSLGVHDCGENRESN